MTSDDGSNENSRRPIPGPWERASGRFADPENVL